ncbi:MAG: sulfotransferase [Gammaproteobacteria bacterium]|nr:sulfotransferase [Gammaproteobacteria bacterium]
MDFTQQLNRAAALASSGHDTDAKAAVQRILAASPDEPNALRLLGLLHVRAGDHRAGIGRLERALAIAPRSVDAGRDLVRAWQRYADVLFDAGRADEARDAQRQAIGCDPFFATVRRAAQASAEGRARDAEAAYRDILKANPDHVHALVGLATVAIDRNAPDDADRLLARAMAVSSNMSHVHRALARLAMSRSRYDEAEASALRATTLNPEQAECWTTLGTVQAWGLKQAEAVESFERALAIDPKAARVKLSLGHVHKALGNADASIDAYHGAVAANPALGEAWWSLADLKTYRFGDDEVEAMQATLDQADLTSRDRAATHFALGKAFEDRGVANTAFDHYDKGNDLRRRQEAFKTDRFVEQCARLRDAFASVAATPPSTTARPRPVFVIGLPRSGSTLVDQILSSHSRVQGTMELPHVLGYVRELERGPDGYPGCVARMTPSDLADLGERYLEETAAYRGDAAYFVDKMPNNFLHVGLIAAMLPEAIFVDSRRHPMACCFSIYKQNFARGQVFGYGLDTLAVYYRNYLTLMRHWQGVLPGRVHRVIYERLVDDTEVETRRLLAHCDLDFEPGCLRFFESDRVVRTASAEQVRQPIYQSGKSQWRQFETQLAPLAQALGDALDTWDA